MEYSFDSSGRVRPLAQFSSKLYKGQSFSNYVCKRNAFTLTSVLSTLDFHGLKDLPLETQGKEYSGFGFHTTEY